MLIADQPSPHLTSVTRAQALAGVYGDRRGLSRRSIRGFRASDALKVFPMDVSADPDYTERFNREADLAAALWHPNIEDVLRSRGSRRPTLRVRSMNSPRRPDLRISCPQGRGDDDGRHGHLRIRPDRPGPSRTERCLEIDHIQDTSLVGVGSRRRRSVGARRSTARQNRTAKFDGPCGTVVPHA